MFWTVLKKASSSSLLEVWLLGSFRRDTTENLISLLQTGMQSPAHLSAHQLPASGKVTSIVTAEANGYCV